MIGYVKIFFLLLEEFLGWIKGYGDLVLKGVYEWIALIIIKYFCKLWGRVFYGKEMMVCVYILKKKLNRSMFVLICVFLDIVCSVLFGGNIGILRGIKNECYIFV